MQNAKFKTQKAEHTVLARFRFCISHALFCIFHLHFEFCILHYKCFESSLPS
jgi:hypothetical protein